MARTLLASSQPKQVGPALTLPVAAGSLDLTFVAADNAQGNYFVPSGHDLLLVKGTGTFTVRSTPDSLGRSGDVGPYALGAGVSHFFVDSLEGLKQADGSVWLDASASTVTFCLVQAF
jgi:hypothetical protein